MCGTDCFLMLLSVLFPPIGVWVKRGLCSADSLINLMLCFLGYLPGLVHSWYIILKYPVRRALRSRRRPAATVCRDQRSHTQDPYSYDPLASDEETTPRAGANTRVTHYYVRHEQPVARPLQQGQQPPQGYGTMPTDRAQHNGGPGASAATADAASAGRPDAGDNPPPYDEAIRGDNKVQRP